MTMTKRRTKKYLAARVLCTLLLGTYLTGGYGELIGHASDPTVTGPVIKGSDDIKTWVGGKSSAWGGSTVADGWYATAFGEKTEAIGNMNTAFGSKTKATGASDATAFGYSTTASGVGATAFGTNTTASGWAATSWGYNAEGDTKKVLANGLASTAFGRSTLAGGDYSTAFGYNTEAGGVMATAYGRNTKALSDNSTAWGYGAQAGQLLYGSDKTEAAIVSYTNSDGKTRFKIVDAKNTATTLKDDFISYSAAYEDSELAIVGAQATAFGKNTKATGVRSTAFGYSSTASGDDSTAFGVETVASGSGATAWGGSIDEDLTLKGGTASGYVSTAFGVETVASGSYSTVWGVWSKATNNLATAWGVGTRASGSSSTAWGDGTIASGSSSTAFGAMTEAIGDRSTAFGYGTQAGQLLYGSGANQKEATIERYTKDGETKYRIVNASDWSDILDNNEGTGFASYEDAFKAEGLTKTGHRATAFGQSTKATGLDSTAFGAMTEAIGDCSTAFGQNTTASGYYSTAFGYYTTADGDYSAAWGSNSVASGHYSTAFGRSSQAIAANSLAALGGIVEKDATNSAAIGKGAKVTVADAVALGSKSVASREAGATDAYLKGSNTGNAWVSTHNAIAVGDDATVTRQITGVAAGSKDTDAVNVAQLKEIAGGAVYTAGAGIDITDNKVSVKADTNDFSFAYGELKLNKNGVVKEGDNGVVTGDTVYKALQAQSASIDSNKANVKLDNITNEGKNVVRELAKESVKTIAGEHTTVTEGTAGNAKTYAVNVVTDGAVASGNAGIVTGGTVFTETRAASDGNYIKGGQQRGGEI